MPLSDSTGDGDEAPCQWEHLRIRPKKARKKRTCYVDANSVPCLGRVTAAGVTWDMKQLQKLGLDQDTLTTEWQFNAL